ncbi:g-type lysozyme inhibitor [Pseudomonas denitrificans (nom. rej.)]|uniref:G-type lysozyme inhibitor n=1 Tax=Pseudomonas denitrificans TaxID=43306 RepID=A0A9X7MYU4_PSEDE|nr:g-type lysozyme inhibitor [Pseudomonas denitrificans (nom. rej.)]QEY71821.1 g-type lysozyme inhibitor [Pseudomonas denitrificans (nom. rej.)]
MKTSLLLFCLLSATPALALAADTVTTVPVHFTKGASSTTVKGSFKGYDTVVYTLSAKAGQHMKVAVSGSNNANFHLYAPGNEPGESTALGSGAVGQDWSGALPASGTYSVQVYQMRATARRGTKVDYSIRFGIE